MTTALLLSLTLVVGLAVGGLEWAWRIERRGGDPHWADDANGEYQAAARERGER